MIFLDTSVLVEALGAGGRLRGALRKAIVDGERMAIPSLVLYEWLRGPRVPEELEAQESLFPSEQAVGFGPEEAKLAAKLYSTLKKPRGREVDLAIAASALVWEATLWTLNVKDFDVNTGKCAQLRDKCRQTGVVSVGKTASEPDNCAPGPIRLIDCAHRGGLANIGHIQHQVVQRSAAIKLVDAVGKASPCSLNLLPRIASG